VRVVVVDGDREPDCVCVGVRVALGVGVADSATVRVGVTLGERVFEAVAVRERVFEGVTDAVIVAVCESEAYGVGILPESACPFVI